jgi:glycosyltransferase involved in cell wall biosynthesis
VTTPAVSVLLPVRDAQETLTACLDSLAAQSLGDYEVVAVDDGCTDGSEDMLAARSRRDSRLRVLKSDTPGLIAALNTALAAARAPLVARMDADDECAPSRLALQKARLDADATTDVLGCGVRLIGEGSEGLQSYVDWQNGLLDHDAIERDRFVESPLVHPSVMMRTEALRALGGWRDFEGPEDYDLWLRALEAGLRFAKLGETLLSWRDSPRRLTRTDSRYSPERFQALKVAALLRGPLAAGREVVVWGAGPLGKSWARALRAKGQPVVAFVEVDPKKIGTRLGDAPVVDVAGAGAWRGPLHLAAVGQKGARDRIRAEASKLGLEDGRDLVAVA